MKEKPFLTFNSQMKYLRDKKKIECYGSNHKTFLIKYGYFNLINAYKFPFVKGFDTDGDHIYIGGTSIEHFVLLKQFDDNLRILLLQTLTRVEEEIRNLVSYKLDHTNGKSLEWYDVQSYNPRKDTQDIIRVISRCFSSIDKMKNDYVSHYTDKYGKVPTWIFTKVIKFSELIDVIGISRVEILEALCTLYNLKDKRGINKHSLLINSLHTIRSVRNSCAHNERIVFFRDPDSRMNLPFETFIVSPNRYKNDRDKLLIDLIVSLKYFMDSRDYESLINQIISMLDSLATQINPSAFDAIRGSLGIKRMTDLVFLRDQNRNKILYNNF